MFKKINKMYSVLFGDYDSNVCSLPQGNITPIVDSVRSLEYQVKEQGKVIEALMDLLSVATGWKSSSLTESKVVSKKIK